MLTMLPTVAVLIAVRIMLGRAVDSEAVGIAIQCVFIMMSLAILYVVFTWAAEHDRRHPRDHTR